MAPQVFASKNVDFNPIQAGPHFQNENQTGKTPACFTPFSQSIFHKRVQATHHGNWATFYICDEAIFKDFKATGNIDNLSGQFNNIQIKN